jgi:hypothetical protein
LVSFDWVGAVIEVMDAPLLARPATSSNVISGATGAAIRLALYTESSVMPAELAPGTGAALTAGVVPARIRRTARPR